MGFIYVANRTSLYFSQFDAVGKEKKLKHHLQIKTPQNDIYAVQGHLRSPTSVLIESDFLLVNLHPTSYLFRDAVNYL